MRSPCCQTRIEVQTDPKNAEYVVVSGGRQKVCERARDVARGRGAESVLDFSHAIICLVRCMLFIFLLVLDGSPSTKNMPVWTVHNMPEVTFWLAVLG